MSEFQRIWFNAFFFITVKLNEMFPGTIEADFIYFYVDNEKFFDLI